MALRFPSAYNPERVIVVFGVVPILGYASGTFITIRRDEPVWSSVQGTNGEFKRVRNRTKSGTVELTLRGTAPPNRPLGLLLNLDELSGGIILPLVITDILNGRRSITADTAVRLGRYFGNSPQFWVDLQGQYDIAVVERDRGAEIAKRVLPADAA